MKTPKISVVMSVYNGMPFLGEAVESILNQTYKDFQFIIVDDASTDDSWQFLKSLKDKQSLRSSQAAGLKRIKLIKNPKNLGLASSLNIGLKAAAGDYIARMDADDISLSDRLQKQVEFLDTHKEYLLVGSQVQWIDGKNNLVKGFDVPQTDEQIRKKLIWRNQIHHATVMFKKSIITQIGGYRTFLNGVEDYDLWFRVMKVGKVFNLPERLVRRRVHHGALTQKSHIKTELLALLIRFMNLPFISLIGLDGLVGIFTFLLYKFWFVNLLFAERLVPPEPDDVYSYLAGAKHLFDISSFEQYRNLVYSIWLNLISTATGLGLEDSFKLNFYLGTIILFVVLIYLLRSLEKNLFQRIVLISMLGLYTGSGAYHGFYWVVPSFYQLTTFFLIIAVMLSKKFKVKTLFFLTLLFIFVHPSSILILLVFPILAILQFFYAKNWQQTKKPLLIFSFGLFAYLLYSLVSIKLPQKENLISFREILNQISQSLDGHLSLISWPTIRHEYFSIVFSNPIFVGGFFLSIFSAWKMKKMFFLFLYFSTLVLVLFSSVIPFGYRTLGFLWPLTFILAGYCFIGIFKIARKISTKVAITTFSIIFILFSIVATNFNLAWIKSVNYHNNYSWDRSCPAKMISSGYVPAVFSSWDGYFAFQTYGLAQKDTEILESSTKIKTGQIIVTTSSFSQKKPTLSKIQKILTSQVTRKDTYVAEPIPNYYWTTLGAVNSNILDSLKTERLMNCGYFMVARAI